MPHHVALASLDPAAPSSSAPIQTILAFRAKAIGFAAMLLAISVSPAGAGIVSGPRVVNLSDTSGFVILSQGNTETSRFGAGPISLSVGNEAVGGTVSYLPSANLSANAAVYGEGNASSYETAEYYFEVVGPANVEVPLTVSAAAALSLGVATPNVAQLYVGNASGPLLTENACYGAIAINCAGASFQSGFSVTAPITVESNQIGDNVQLSLSVNANTLFSGASSDIQSGYIDPVITIDPSFSLASEFQLVFSPGVGNSPSSVPEPATIALFAIGLAGLAAFRRTCGTRTVVRHGSVGTSASVFYHPGTKADWQKTTHCRLPVCKSQDFREVFLALVCQWVTLPARYAKKQPAKPSHWLCPRDHLRADP